jgi:hypothetical protein
MREVYDFSNALVRCHAIYFVVGPGKEKTPKQKYDAWQALLIEEMTKYDGMGEKKQGMANGLKKAAKIAGIEYEINRLYPNRFDDPITTNAKSYLKRLYGEIKYGKWSASKDIGSKYLTKGRLAEKDSLDLISFLDGEGYEKNEKRLENAFLSGVPDSFRGSSIHEAYYIPDVKSSWDFETFIDNVGKPLNPVYWWQLQGYLDLTGADEGEVSFCLVNTPDSIIEDEKYRLARRLDALTNESPEYKKAEAFLIKNMTFDDIPPIERRLKFGVKRDEEAIKKIHEAVPKCRDYLFELQELHLTGYFSDKELPILETIEEF